MKLDYATLISPYPLFLQDIGHIKPPTVRNIWNPDVSYKVYNMYLNLLIMDVKSFCDNVNTEWFNSFSDEEKKSINMFDIISADEYLQEQYCKMLDFFFVENVKWDKKDNVFVLYTTENISDEIIDEEYMYKWFEKTLIKFGFMDKKKHIVTKTKEHEVGKIHKQIWDELCDVILQWNNIKKNKEEKKLKFKSKLAQEVWELTHPKEKHGKQNKDMELPNIISSVAAKDESLNMINIWDLTVYQLYDQFQRLQGNTYFSIQSMSVAAYGDEKNKFDGGAWYHNIYEN